MSIMTPLSRNRQHGFTLAELMVAVAIGLMITLAIGSLFISTQRGTKENDAVSRMQENARFALELLTTDLRHAGFMGNIPNPAGTDIVTMTLLAPVSSCGPLTSTGKPGLYNFERARDMLSFGNQITAANVDAYYSTCLNGATDRVKPNSSILMLKHVERLQTPPMFQDDPTTAQDETQEGPACPPPSGVRSRCPGNVYLYANGANAMLYTHTSPAETLPITNGEHWEYQPHLYYIMDEDANDNDRLDGGEDTNGNGRLDTDVLYRKQLRGLDLVSEPLAEGIEAFNIEFGIDVESGGAFDGSPDYYFTPPQDGDPWGSAEMDNAVSATIYVLARTTEPNPDPTYRDLKHYQLGRSGPVIDPPAEDRYLRRVYSITVMLKNLRSQVMAL